ncbi:hypothetical protein QR680_010773 [Steinernema hermaphroditum]|uniref:non-specific serine/threonine protein kinase n=1 Tax=Steinernema hermaphroditum TaxID=289476 RepID=A0AA39MCD1_9BILA|nr:hypothetical protein QR680_010773 [Steinernema hermaphroditum]
MVAGCVEEELAQVCIACSAERTASKSDRPLQTTLCAHLSFDSLAKRSVKHLPTAMRTPPNVRDGTKDKQGDDQKLSKEVTDGAVAKKPSTLVDHNDPDIKAACRPDLAEVTPPSSEEEENRKEQKKPDGDQVPVERKPEKESRRGSKKKKGTTDKDSIPKKSRQSKKKRSGTPPLVAAVPANPAPVIARGKYAPPHLKPGTVLNKRFLVGLMKTGGAFGQIYTAIDQADNKTVAIKVEPEGPDAGRMILEQRVLKALRGTGHAPTLIGSGTYNGFMFLIMEMLGRNLTDLRKRQPKKRFTASTAIRIALQGIQAVYNLHNIGFIHRDIKPMNMVIGCTSVQQNVLYLLDYGMTRQYRFENGAIRKERIFACFRGTLRYVSLNVHDMKEQGPVDDLWSLFYTLVELGEGALPWRHATETDVIANKKRNTPLAEFVQHLPKGVLEFARHLEGVKAYPQMPDYKLIQTLLNEAMGPTAEQTFEWENQHYEGPEEPSS